jgi:sulfur carrier protein
MNLVINGKEKEIPKVSSVSVANFLHYLDYSEDQKRCIAIAVNLEFVPKSSYSDFILDEGDQIEIVSPTAGG